MDKGRKEKFRSMIAVLTQHAHMRTKLISGEVSPSEILRMKREDFLSADLKRQMSEAEEARMQANRTDWARAQDRKVGYKDSFFTCKKCRSKKTSYYQQQTRGADEPMTNFIECLDCQFKWKE
uniref:TFIIS-type domain-containing protein n=1 Tax=Favella ehrenbergii TaxID=182087 RepID=A0A7S3MPU9_9SPIT|mmetsp:Transcript_7218/g.10085  ORF Transcript_7218/g.10085 Transcript_7218/m.10085 type:complete len:123 (+) Transcript_7218:668-1036(+)